MDSSFSLYMHIPFCKSFCDYCDFYSITTDKKDHDYIDKYICALLTDIKNQITRFSAECITTAYIGGGTPSVLGGKIGFLLEELYKLPGFKPVEFTIEANPESLTENFLEACRKNGINRLSLGVQTLHEPSRKIVNRKGDIKAIKENIELACEYFNGELSFDLITGLPCQSEETIICDIKSLLEYEPSHISLYSLSVEEDTALKEKLEAKMLTLPDKDCADSLWLCAKNALLKAGYNHYEVSNFAKEGRECVHNMRYWQMESWLGAGAAASGTVIGNDGTAKRFTYANDADAYIKRPDIENALCENLDRDTFLRESLLMGFRCRKGPDTEVFKRRFNRTIEQCIPNTLLKYSGRDKMLFLNSFLSDAFCELDGAKLRV